jgi:hypothetical protein
VEPRKRLAQRLIAVGVVLIGSSGIGAAATLAPTNPGPAPAPAPPPTTPPTAAAAPPAPVRPPAPAPLPRRPPKPVPRTPAPTPVTAPPPLSVPPGIAGDCSRPVDALITQWIRSVPDGSTLRFASNGCYGIDAAVVVSDHRDLTIDGNGSMFKTLTTADAHRSNWRLQHDTNIALVNMTIRGANPNAGVHGTHMYNGVDYEWQHGVSFDGVQGGTLDHVEIYNVYGDSVEAAYDTRDRVKGYLSGPSRGIAVRHSRLDGAGRHGVGLTDVDGFVLEDSWVGNVGEWAIDLELNAAPQYGRNVTIQRNTFGPLYFSVLSNWGPGSDPNVGSVTIADNTMTSRPATCWPAIFVSAPAHEYRSSWTVTGHRFLSQGEGMHFARARKVRIAGNSLIISGHACADYGVSLVDSHDVVIENNTFTGLGPRGTAIKQDPSSTGVTAQGNRS